jgi:Family of unknown function (DUF6390)
LGYCGPPDSAALRGYGLTGAANPELARSFAGAWPYLELIAGHAGIPDPLDRRVVEAYWVGNRLLDTVGLAGPVEALAEHFGHPREVLDGGLAHHSFHVLCMYPWVRLLDDRRTEDRALSVLDQCRIRWGRVTAVRGDRVLVRCRPLTWHGRRLELGRPVVQPAEASMVGAAELAVGDRVSLHWQWVCDRLSDRQVRALRGYTRRHLDLVNRRIAERDRTAAPDRI